MSDLSTGGINFEYPCTFRIDKEAVEKQDKALRKSIEKAFTIEELEKIRVEIENHCGLAKEENCKYCSYCHNLMGVREILEIIDKYKAELKGENNG